MNSKLEFGLKMLFPGDEGGMDPLVNLVGNGLYRGGSYLGQKAKAGLAKFRPDSSSDVPDIPEGPIRVPPEAPSSTGPEGSSTVDLTWLKGILVDMAKDLSTIKGILVESKDLQQDLLERSELQNLSAELDARNSASKAEKSVVAGDSTEEKNGIDWKKMLILLGLLMPKIIEYLKSDAAKNLKNAVDEKIGDALGIPEESRPMLVPSSPLPAGAVSAAKYFGKTAALGTAAPSVGQELLDPTKPKAPVGFEFPQPPKPELEKPGFFKNIFQTTKDLAKAGVSKVKGANVLGALGDTVKGVGSTLGSVKGMLRNTPLIGSLISGGVRMADGQDATQIAAGVGGEIAGGLAGAKIGAGIGGGLSLFTGGLGAPILVPVGAAIGGLAGSYFGGKAADYATGVVENDEKKLQEKVNEGTNELVKSNEELKSALDELKDTVKNGGSQSANLDSGTSTETTNEKPVLDQTYLNDEDGYLKNLVMAESSGNPNARASTSSAAGLGQVTRRTWISATKQMGVNWSLQDRFDPEKNLAVTKFLTEQNRKILSKGLGTEPTNAELYTAHFLGPGTALTFLNTMRTRPGARADTLFPTQAAANPNIFKDGRSVSDVFEVLSKKINKTRTLKEVSESATKIDNKKTAPVIAINAPAATPTSAPMQIAQAGAGSQPQGGQLFRCDASVKEACG